VHAIYHVCRLREGADTRLDPTRRLETIEAIKAAGLDFVYCCEPIGPEHTAEELADQLLLGFERGCSQHAAMRRVAVPQLPLGKHGQISELRLAQIVAVVALASLGSPNMEMIGVHEPNVLGLTSGANAVFAETGANPRDTSADTSAGRGLDVAAARAMLHEAGFRYLRRGDGVRVELTPEYMAEKLEA
jgi:biotin synthase